MKEQKEEPFTYKEQKKNQKLNISEGALYAGSAGVSANFIVPYALTLGVPNTFIGAISTLPALIGAFTQLGAQHVRRLFSTRRKYMAFCALMQAIFWLPMLFLPLFSEHGPWLLFFLTLNTVSSMMIGPIWNAFTGDIVPEAERGRFFGIRNTITGSVAFVSTLCAGLLLNWLKPSHPLLGFIILFSLAFGFRLASSYTFFRMGAPPEGTIKTEFPEPHQLLLHANETPFGKFTLFLTLFYVAVSICSPFFTVYQLSILQFSYLQFTMLLAVGAIASVVTTFLWGRYVDKIGSRNVLLVCGLLTPLVPFLWGIFTNFYALAGVEIISAIAWAGFGLSVSTYIFDATERETRSRRVSEHTLLIQLASFGGAMLGSYLLKLYGESDPHAFIAIFMLSAALRLIIVLLFIKVIVELRMVEIPIKGRIFKSFLAIRPQQGIVYTAEIDTSQTAFTRQSSRDVRDTMRRYAQQRQDIQKPPSQVKNLERSSEQENIGSYQKRLRR